MAKLQWASCARLCRPEAYTTKRVEMARFRAAGGPRYWLAGAMRSSKAGICTALFFLSTAKSSSFSGERWPGASESWRPVATEKGRRVFIAIRSGSQSVGQEADDTTGQVRLLAFG